MGALSLVSLIPTLKLGVQLYVNVLSYRSCSQNIILPFISSDVWDKVLSLHLSKVFWSSGHVVFSYVDTFSCDF